ncbi:energy transducer TonB [Spirosoma rhododendri]|uniref:TonB C-terminal domain-containing protein n=1 Tax=Spirosoma rhododendri TaxID=2728024 RepID=A0A7L5DNV2_9BACT|nr:energy transducer TonB [Spirosoma rhododendri]QJD79161.1 hypothetical protein HH216_12595 [Spirosoma rhododendri]
MLRLFLILSALWLSGAVSHAQLTVYQDRNGQVFTAIEEYGPGIINATAYKKLIYAGSPFLTFPVWQPGRVRLDEQGKYIACDVAYDLVSNAVMCRFAGDSAVKTLRPDRFIIGQDEFIRQQNRQANVDYKFYAKALNGGKTKLLLNLSKRGDIYARASSNTGYEKETNVNGGYVLQEKYYIRKGDARPEQISLTKNAVLAVLYEQADKLAPRLTARRPSPADIIAILPYYDSLMTVQWAAASAGNSVSDAAYVAGKNSLSANPVFNQTLHNHVAYPDAAWTQGIYARVYAGFEIDQRGNVQNVTILSPDNVGTGFVETVRNGLKKLPTLDPALAGSYVLPVAFTYTNKNENGTTHAPINRLPNDRLAGRLMLEEFSVPIVVTKPVQTSREVWGYFK